MKFLVFISIVIFLNVDLANANDFDIQKKISQFLNSQLNEFGYKSVFKDEECWLKRYSGKSEEACTYNYAFGAYANVIVLDKKYSGFQLLMSTPEYKGHDIYRDSMFIFSLLIWGNMEKSAKYDDAKSFLLSLWKKYLDNDRAERGLNGWRYMIIYEDSCLGENVQMIGVNEASIVTTDQFLGLAQEFCPKQ